MGIPEQETWIDQNAMDLTTKTLISIQVLSEKEFDD